MSNEPVRRGAWILAGVLTGLQFVATWGGGADVRSALGETAAWAVAYVGVLRGGAEVLRGTFPQLTKRLLGSTGTFGPESARTIATYAATLDPSKWRELLREFGFDESGAPELIGSEESDLDTDDTEGA